MQKLVLVNGDLEGRECVKDHYGQWICEGMYVNETGTFRQGFVTEVIDNNNGFGNVKIRVVRERRKDLDEKNSYVTDFLPSINWCKALVDG